MPRMSRTGRRSLPVAGNGLPVDQAPCTREAAQGWFKKQPEATQLQMMGPARLEAWKAGDFEWADMAKVEDNPIWGKQAVTKPVGELVG